MFEKFLFGHLTWANVPLHNPVIMGALVFTLLIAFSVLGVITYMKKWTYLWTDWVTSVDHKKIGAMYVIFAGVMLLRGFVDALMMRLQQALAVAPSTGYLPAHHFAEIFSAHGVIMIFFVAMPLMFGLVNLGLPLVIGARDVAFPYLNSLSLWLTIVSGMLIMMSLFIGDFAATGWLAYPPLSGIIKSPTVGVDYYIWAVQISGVGSLLSGINFFVTILKMRCPGMTLMRMPIFAWTVLCTMVLVMLAFPILTATLAMLFLDRTIGMHFFTMGHAGNYMMYVNLIWAWGHPEVYILILPAFGIFSEITATFCRKRLFGYSTMVWATFAITILSFVVWLHHFFTMGSGADVNAFFGIMTMIIAVPTGVKVFNWLFTMYKGRIHYDTPMLWTVAFLFVFVVGGMTGVLMAVPPVDFQMHNSVFLVAHFHNVIIGGVLFGYLAGLAYWFPKIFGFTLNERLGKYSIICWVVGFTVAFAPLYILGMKGMTRRLHHYSVASGYHPYLVVAGIGALIIATGIFFQILQLVVSIKNRQKNRDVTGDPWDGRTLEWSIPSPAPFYNFAVTPTVHGRDPFWEEKERIKAGEKPAKPHYTDIHMPRNTSVGFLIAVFAAILGFGSIWHIVWMIGLGLVGMVVAAVVRTFDQNIDYYVKASEVAKIEAEARGGATS